MIKQRNPQQYGLPVEVRIDDVEQFQDVLIVPHRAAPVIRQDGARAVLLEMRFSLLPSWSKEPKVKFATHNARLETIDEKPTWKNVFINRHCVVPLTSFIEPIYEGDHAGHMVAFSRNDEQMLLAAGLWDEWVNKTTGEVIQSFAIITHEPPPFIAAVGHDRCPVFVGEAAAKQWLENEGSKPQELKQYLLQSQEVLELKVHNHRPMRPGWEKRK